MAKSVTYIMEFELALILNFICTVLIRNFSFFCIIAKVIRQFLALKCNKISHLKSENLFITA